MLILAPAQPGQHQLSVKGWSFNKSSHLNLTRSRHAYVLTLFLTGTLFCKDPPPRCLSYNKTSGIYVSFISSQDRCSLVKTLTANTITSIWCVIYLVKHYKHLFQKKQLKTISKMQIFHLLYRESVARSLAMLSHHSKYNTGNCSPQ